MRLETALKEYRTRARVTQQGLADACGVTRQTIIAVEKGRFNPSVALALHMARHLGTTVHDLFRLPEETQE
jgi:putative transcriptional regulator